MTWTIFLFFVYKFFFKHHLTVVLTLGSEILISVLLSHFFMSLLTLKYIPQHSSQIIGQSLALVQLKEFIQNYKKQKYKAALLYGPVGTGKTSSVYALAKELNYDILEINSSDWTDEKSINLIVGGALGQQSLFFRGSRLCLRR